MKTARNIELQLQESLAKKIKNIEADLYQHIDNKIDNFLERQNRLIENFKQITDGVDYRLNQTKPQVDSIESNQRQQAIQINRIIEQLDEFGKIATEQQKKIDVLENQLTVELGKSGLSRLFSGRKK